MGWFYSASCRFCLVVKEVEKKNMGNLLFITLFSLCLMVMALRRSWKVSEEKELNGCCVFLFRLGIYA